jgi:glycine/D-amino acid oxidase-like deaminating enzyme
MEVAMSPTVERVESDLHLPDSADVVVIGGGIIGVAAAYFLAKKGLSVALVEKGHVAGEQSSRNWGWCRLQGRTLPELPLAAQSHAIWSGLDRELGADTGFQQTGILLVTKDQAEIAHWEQWTEQARDFQIPGQILTAAEVKAMVPATSAPWLGGWYSPTCGRAEPSRAAPALARGARALGVTIHQGCAARGLETKGGRVSAVVTEKGTIRTAAVLCAGGAWTSMFCRHHGIPFAQAGVFATACRTSPGPAVTEGAIGSDGFSFRRREDGGYTVAMRGRGRVELTPQGLRYTAKFLPLLIKQRKAVTLGVGRSFFKGPETFARWSLDDVSPFERIRVLDPAPDRQLVDRAMNAFRAAYPVLSEIKVEQAWGGLIDSTPDSIPVISGVDKLPGFYVAAGFSGHGFALGPGAGRLAADLVAGDTPIVDPQAFRYSRLVDGTRLMSTKWN